MLDSQTVFKCFCLVIIVVILLMYTPIKNYFSNRKVSDFFYEHGFCIKHDYRLIAILPKTKGVMIKCTKCGKDKSIYIDRKPHNARGIWIDREYLDSGKWNKIMKVF